MKILHLDNTANVAVLISKGLRKYGIQSDVMELTPNPFHYPVDIKNYFGHNPFSKFKCVIRNIKIADNYDIIHIHSGITWNRFDLVFIKKILDRPLIVHFHGSDARLGYGMHFIDFIDKKIISTPDLFKWLPDAVHIQNPMVLNKYIWDDNKICVIHLPSKREIKGTDIIIKAVEIAQKKVDFDFKIVENVQYSIAMQEISKSHVVIDQVYPAFGNEGMVSLEAMSMGKIPVCYINPEYRNEDIPIISPDEPTFESLADCLIGLIKIKYLMKLQSKICYDYIKNNRTPEIIAKQYIPLYKEVLN